MNSASGRRLIADAIDTVRPYPSNPRKNEAAVEAVARSISEFGWRVPIVVDEDGTVTCGHTRLKAAERLGLERVPVHVATGLTPAPRRGMDMKPWNGPAGSVTTRTIPGESAMSQSKPASSR